MPFSHHSHSGQFCAHAKNTLEEMVQAAISRGFETFALTEHIPRDNDDLYPEEERESLGSLTTLFDAYYQEAVRLRELYASEIRILIGFETEWIRPRSLEIINELLDRYQFDLFIGSVHHVHTVPIDFDRDLYEKSRANSEDCDEKLAERYFDDQHDMLQILKPPVVGHLDLIRLFSDNKHVEFKRWETVWNRINRNLDFIASYGGLLELNSSAFRKGMKTPYPEADICKYFLEKGGKFTLSDDSHSVEQVGLNYHRMFKFLVNIGIQRLWFIEQGGEGIRVGGKVNMPQISSLSVTELVHHRSLASPA